MGKKEIRDHFELMAENYDHWKKKNAYYYSVLKRYCGRHTRSNDSVIEFGSGTGDILNAVPGKEKVGIDIAQAMVDRAHEKYPDITFERHDCESAYGEPGKFDVAILADLIDHVTDILDLFASANHSLKIGGRMCISSISPLWDPPFLLAEKLGLKMPEGEHSFVPNRDLINFLKLRGFRLVEDGSEFLIPKRIPFISEPINKLAPHLPLIWRFCAMQTIVAEKIEDYTPTPKTEMTCSVIIPCFNERENITRCIERIPDMGAGTEIIVVDDGSTDGTADAAKAAAESDPRVKVIAYSPNRGKGPAVKAGFDAATSDIIMICDADMTVMPEELPLFVQPITDGLCDFTNGTRMIYAMEDQAMRYLNHIGNFFFGLTLSWLLSQRVSDTLCGTKALRRTDYANIEMGNDKWGDFDLLFGAAENDLKIAEIPVHYKARTEGDSKMQPFKHCMVLLKVCWIGFVRLKLRRIGRHKA